MSADAARIRSSIRLELFAMMALAATMTGAGAAGPITAQESPLFSPDPVAGLDFRQVGPSFRSGRVVDMAVQGGGRRYAPVIVGVVWNLEEGVNKTELLLASPLMRVTQ